jgi:enoyl-CoA hydratase/carnithine racemase
MSGSTEERVKVSIEEHVATVTLVRGGKHNGLDWAMFVAIDDALTQLRDAEAVRAVVLCGEGPSFCAGLDFASFLADGRDLNGELLERDGAGANLAQRVACGWRDLEVPVIAALQGVCFGGGCQIALGADVRLAAPDTRMSVMEIKYGLVPDMGITRTLASLVRSDHARELVHTGRVVEAPEALALGLVTRIVADPQAASRELAGEIAARSPQAIRAGKRLLNDIYAPPGADTLALETELQRQLLGTPNQAEAVQAALTRREARFEDSQPAGANAG